MSMGFGVFLLVVIFGAFVVTHMIKMDGDVDSLELAATLALILFSGFAIYCAMYFLRGLL
jgi:hypothetical protein